MVFSGEWIIGQPFDLDVPLKSGGIQTLRLINMASRIDPKWLIEYGPNLVQVTEGLQPSYDPTREVVVSMCRTVFDGHVIEECWTSSPRTDTSLFKIQDTAGQIRKRLIAMHEKVSPWLGFPKDVVSSLGRIQNEYLPMDREKLLKWIDEAGELEKRATMGESSYLKKLGGKPALAPAIIVRETGKTSLGDVFDSVSV
jgi:hypothetical protein